MLPVPLGFFLFDLRFTDGLTIVADEDAGTWPFGSERSHRAFSELMHPEDRETYFEHMGRAASGRPGAMLCADVRLRTPQGDYRSIRIVGLACFEEGAALPTTVAGAFFPKKGDDRLLDRVLLGVTNARTLRMHANESLRRIARVADDLDPKQTRVDILRAFKPTDTRKIELLMLNSPLAGASVFPISLGLLPEFGGATLAFRYLRFWSSRTTLHLIAVGFVDDSVVPQSPHRRIDDLERCLQLSLDAYERQLDASSSFSDGMTIFDGARLIQVNEAAVRMLGYDSRRDLEGMHWNELFNEEEALRIGAVILPAFLRDGTWRGELRMKRRDGSTNDVECTASRMASGTVCVSWRDISEHKRTEKRIRESEEHLALAVEGSDLVVWARDADGTISLVGDRFAAMLGRSVEDIQAIVDVWARLLDSEHGPELVAAMAEGRRYDGPLSPLPQVAEADADAIGFIHHADVPALLTAIFDHIGGQTSHLTAEYRLRTRAGKWMWVLLHGRVLTRADDGRPLRVAGVGLEISKRKHAELAADLQNTIARLLTAATTGTDILPTVLEAMGRALDFQVGLVWTSETIGGELSRSAWWSPDEEVIERFLEGGGAGAATLGEGMVGAVQRSREALWLNDIAGHHEFPCFATASSLGLKTAAAFPIDAGERISGVLAFFAEEDRPADAGVVELVEAICRQLGQYLERAHATAELNRRSLELARANAELAESVKSRDDFLATLSHELRTPLTAILGTAESLRRGFFGELAPEPLRRVESLETTGWHLSRMINEIFDMLKFKFTDVPLQESNFELVELGHDALAMMKQAAEELDIRIRFSLEPLDLVMRGDRRRVLQAVSNLLSNAIKFTPSGHEIGFSVKQADGGSGDLMLVVWDEGPGLDLSIAERLFEPYVQSDRGIARQGAGLGLGLPLARAIARRHGGDVLAGAREEGSGAEFTIVLPASRIVPSSADGTFGRPRPPRTAAARFPVPERAASGKRVLVVDDSGPNRELLQMSLTHLGYEVETAVGGLEGIAAARAHRPDAVLMDVMMPGVDGLTAIRELRAGPGTADVPIAAVTAANVPGDRERCIAAGADAYLSKPFSSRQLAELVDELITLERSPRGISDEGG